MAGDPRRFRRGDETTPPWTGALGFAGRGAILLGTLWLGSVIAAVPQIASSDSHTLVLKADGSLWAWGSNRHGVLGDCTTIDRKSPVKVGEGFQAITAGRESSYAIKSDGSLWGWGAGYAGQLGDGGMADQPCPTVIGYDFRVVSANWSMAVGIKRDGSLWSWGGSAYGGLGDGRMEVHWARTPQLIGHDYLTVHTSMAHVLAIKRDGTLWAWGLNAAGQLGTGDFYGRAAPVQIGSGFVEVSAGESHSLALKSDGTVWTWGENTLGQLGLGAEGTILDAASETSARLRSRPAQVPGQHYVAATNGSYHSHALTADGGLWGWGMGSYGALGDSRVDPGEGRVHLVVTPTRVGDGYWMTTRGGGNNNGFAIKFDGLVWAWGANAGGQLGDGTEQDRPTPIPIGLNVLPQEGFVTSVSVEGPAGWQSITASLAANQADAGRNGCIFVGAVLASGRTHVLSTSGWSLFDPKAPRAYFCGRLLAYQAELIRDVDTETLRGTELLLGYGVGDSPEASFADMLQRGRIKSAYSVR